MAKFLSYDIFESDLYKVQNDADLKYLLLQTTKKSVLVLNFMDAIFSSYSDERIMVFTMNSKENVGASILRTHDHDHKLELQEQSRRGIREVKNS